MVYAKTTWKPGPDGGTLISAARLNNIEDGVANNDLSNPDSPALAILNDAVAQAAKGAGAIDPAAHGVPADGVADATQAFQLLLDNAEPGATISSRPGAAYKITSPLAISTRATLVGGTFIANPTGATLSVEADDVTIDGVTISGVASAGVDDRQRLIVTNGTSASPIRRLSIRNVRLMDSAYAHMWLDWLVDFDISNNHLENGRYAGIMLISPKGGTVTSNVIREITQGGTLVNSYGIAATDIDNTRAARAEDVLIAENFIDGVPNWEGIDTHGGRNIRVLGNTVRNCRTPIAITTGNLERNTPPEDCLVDANYVDKGSAPTETAGIVFNGKQPDKYAYGMIGHNVIQGFSKDVILDWYTPERTHLAAQSTNAPNRRSPSAQPYRFWAANSVVSVDAGVSGGSTSIVFPEGFFTATPIVQVTKGSGTGARHVPYVTDATAAGCTVGVYDPTGGISAVSIPVAITVTQSGPNGNGDAYS